MQSSKLKIDGLVNHHDRFLVTPTHENSPLSTLRGERARVRGVYFHGKKFFNRLAGLDPASITY